MTDENQNALAANDDLVSDQDVVKTEVTSETTEEVVKPEPTGEELSAKAEADAAEEERQAKKRERRQRAREKKREVLAAFEQIKTAGEGDEPKEDDFADFTEFVAAKAVYAYRKKDHQSKVELAEAQANAAAEAEKTVVNEDWLEQVDAAKQRMPDFEAVAFSAPISDQVSELVLSSDMATDVAYHLGKNHAEARRISQLPPVEAARELGRIEARLSVPQPKPKTTKAPPPIEPVQGGAGNVDPAKMDFAAYERWRNAG